MSAQALTERTSRTVLPVALSAAVSAALVLAGPHIFGWAGYLWALLVVVALTGGWIAAVDVRTMRLPNRFTAPLAVAGAVQIAGSFLYVGGNVGLPAVIAAVVVFASYALMAAAGWSGFGDAKFAGAIALFVGLYVGLLAIYLVPVAIIIGAAHMLVVKLSRRVSTLRVPQGPAITAAAIIIMALGLSSLR